MLPRLGSFASRFSQAQAPRLFRSSRTGSIEPSRSYPSEANRPTLRLSRPPAPRARFPVRV